MNKEIMRKKTWNEFRDSKMLWFINRTIHLFGWAICVEIIDGDIVEVFPARVKYRGFSEESEAEGFATLTEHIRDNIYDLVDEAKS